MPANEDEIEILNEEIEDLAEPATLELKPKKSLPSSALINEIDPLGIIDAKIARPQSVASIHSQKSWSSGKKMRAPQPPPRTSSAISLDGPSRRSSCCAGKKPNTFKEKLIHFSSDPRKQKQVIMWSAFVVIVIVTVIMVGFVVHRFTSGFGGTNAVYEDGEDWGTGREEYQALNSGTKKREDFLLLLGGQDEERQDSNEILTKDGTCHMIQGYPKPLPSGRSGHIAAAVSGEKVVVCGGLDAKTRALTSICWLYMPKENDWIEIASLRQAVRYAAATALKGSVMVAGGTNKHGQKTNQVQVLNMQTNSWSEGIHLPQSVWGHCAATAPNGDIIVTGGWTNRAVRSNMHNAMRLKDGANNWEILEKMVVGRATHGCAGSTVKKGTQSAVIVAGGMDFGHTPVSRVEVLILVATPRWVNLGDLKKARSWYPAVGVLRDRLFVAAGKGYSDIPADTVETYNPKAKRWIVTDITLQWKREDTRSVLVPRNWFPNCIR